MSYYYKLTRKANSPISLAEAKSYLKKSPGAGPDDDLIQQLIDAATDHAEKYIGRDLRKNRWSLSIDCFAEVIRVRRDPVDEIKSITRLVSGTATAVDADVYYLVPQTQYGDIRLMPDQDWPTDQDEVSQAVVITFDMRAHECLPRAIVGILRHLAYLYENRGDCPGGVDGAAALSGANKLYDLMRIARV